MHIKDWSEFRMWVENVAAGTRAVTADEVVEVVRELLDEIDSLHNRYAHEGGKPQQLADSGVVKPGGDGKLAHTPTALPQLGMQERGQ